MWSTGLKRMGYGVLVLIYGQALLMGQLFYCLGWAGFSYFGPGYLDLQDWPNPDTNADA